MKSIECLVTIYRSLVIFAALLIFADSAIAAGPTQKVLYRFKGGRDGSTPYAGLVLDSAGNLYGTTLFGGGACKFECGTVFELSPDPSGGWNEAVLYRFAGPDGKYPQGALVLDSIGNLYGTTSNGGKYNGGIVFKLTPGAGGVWTESIVHYFGHGTDGGNPSGVLVWDSAGNLYGAAQGGGSKACQGGCGTVFKLTPTPSGPWKESTLYAFKGGTDGSWVRGGLAFDAAGNLYGTTALYPGTVFKLTPTARGAWKKTILHSFQAGADGSNPEGDLIFDAAGNLYGVTNTDGGCVFCGTVFQLMPEAQGPWKKTTLYDFKGAEDGRQPYAGVVFDAQGNLYGATSGSGDATCDCGTVFKLTPNPKGWRGIILHTFKGRGDGASPRGGLILDPPGNLYGTTSGDGSGVVYEITP